MTTLHLRISSGRSPWRRAFLLIPLALALAWLALSPAARAVVPAPDGGYPNENTAEGTDALFSLTTGFNNTANGASALYSNTTGEFNTANGAFALYSNTTGRYNTATGNVALGQNTTAYSNTANGAFALNSNTTGNDNTASGAYALQKNTVGYINTAYGSHALAHNKRGHGNTATGGEALSHSDSGDGNTATGLQALTNNTTGSSNTALGNHAGSNLTTGDNNIDIGNSGVAAEANTIRIGTVGTQTNTYVAGISGATVAGGVGVIIDTDGHLGTIVSSERFKDAIKPMDKASEAILALKPVTFRYKHELDPKGIPQFGLVAEQVAKVNPDLVARDEEGKPYTVRYEAVNAMLLNEFLKEHRKVEEQARKGQEQEATITQVKATVAKQAAIIAQLKSTVAQQQEGMEVLTASLKEQALQIQKVSAQLEVTKPAPRMVANDE
jgi:hypothetical protein